MSETYQFPADFVVPEGEPRVTSERPGRVRWRRGFEWSDAEPRVLQQLWYITTYRDGRPGELTEEWRDVPLEAEE